MSRAGWAATLLIGAALGLGIWLLTRGLDPSTVAAHGSMAKLGAEVASAIADQRNRLKAIVAQDEGFMGPRPEVAAAGRRLDAISAEHQQGQALMDGPAKQYIDDDDHSDTRQLLVTLANAEKHFRAARDQLAGVLGDVERTLLYKTRADNYVQQAREAVKQADALAADSKVRLAFDSVVLAWPDARPPLEKKLNQYTSQLAEISQQGQAFEAMLTTEPADYVARGQLSDRIGELTRSAQSLQRDLMKEFVAITLDLDKILIDMKEEGGKYHHKYAIIEGGKRTETPWIEVTREFYTAHRDHLGMTIYNKPAGKLTEQGDEIASPPGYHYVGNERYGQWVGTGPQRFWMFYGQYAFMRDVFWGPGYFQPVYYSHYTTYRQHHSQRRPY